MTTKYRSGPGFTARESGGPLPDELPILPLREAVVFPLTFGSIHHPVDSPHLGEALEKERVVVVTALREGHKAVSTIADLHTIGTLARVHEIVNVGDGSLHLATQGLERVRISELTITQPYVRGRIVRAKETNTDALDVEALGRAAGDLFAKLVALDSDLPNEFAAASRILPGPVALAYFIASVLPMPKLARQELLELDAIEDKLRRLIELLQHEVTVREVGQKIKTDTTKEMEKAQREQILRKHLDSIKKELGELDPDHAEGEEIRARLRNLPLNEEARKEVDRELDRLERIPSVSPEYGMVRTYLDWIAKLPWEKLEGAAIDVVKAREVLDEDHYDLQRVKDRIVEYLAVKRLRDDRGTPPRDPAARPIGAEPILCLVGPPGVGKTSIGQSIARAMGRKFARISLGGTHDEAEIRGHRRTYIGSMPGRILQALARAGASDPVFMLDEIDKLGSGYHGDPAAALLEVLDPSQNHAFVDNYLAVPFDLSKVVFLCTANALDPIPAPLRDRLEVIELPGYTDREKLSIAERYLFKRQLETNGLREGEVSIDNEVLMSLIRDYTRESGVRNLEREIGAVLRKVARRIGEGKAAPIHVGIGSLEDYLGSPRYFAEVAERLDRPGIATGLAWTPAGGDILFVEATVIAAEEERLVLTGMLGDVMRESAQAALSYLRSNAVHLGVDPKAFERKIVHIHVPVGAIPKDGPSAGVTMLTALASAVTERPVRNDVGMTGEITLRGKVLPVGGIKGKLLAAHRAGLKTILLPKKNESSLDDIPDDVRRALHIVLVETIEDVLEHVLEWLPNEESNEPQVPELTRDSIH